MKCRRTVSAVAIAMLLAGNALAVDLFTEDFEVDPTATWTLNGGPSDETADFFFDYSTAGIPLAPNSAVGAIRGLAMQANVSSGIFGGLSVSPNDQSFTGDYQLEFDWWANFHGPFPVGGNGSTQLSTFGIGTAGTTAQWPGGIQDSVWFGGTGDGNSSVDWRAYSSAAGTGYLASSGVFAAGTGTAPDARNNSHPYYADFGQNAAPASQLTLYPQQTGSTVVGSAGMEWHRVRIAKNGASATWSVDDVLIATIDLTTVTLGGSNIFLGHSDINALSSTDPNDVNLLFTLIDNVKVSTIDAPTGTPDFNGNTVIDAADYVVWRDHEGLTGTGTQATGDANGDFNVDQLDFNLWAAQFGNTVPGTGGGAAAAVPEPSASVLALGSLVAVGLCARSRSRKRIFPLRRF